MLETIRLFVVVFIASIASDLILDAIRKRK